MLIFSAIIGFAVLIMGRQLFWVTVAGLGFILGLNYAMQYFQGSPEMILLASLGVGLVGAILAYTLQRAAAGLVGFMAGWYLIATLLNFINVNIGDYALLVSVLGGLIGVGLIFILFDWSLILLSSLAGALIIMQSLQFNRPTNIIIFVILFLLGLTVQAILFLQEKDDFNR